MKALTGLRKKLVEEKQTTDAAVEEVLAAAGVPESPVSFDSWRIEPTLQFHDDAPDCYRTFVSVSELESYFTFLRQEEYAKYSRVIYVAATTSLTPGVTLQHITKPIKNIFTIEAPEGVEVSRHAASAGDRVMLTYNKEGFSPLRESVIVGRPSMYVTYEGAVMKVKSSKECRLNFVRRIPITVKSAKGGNVAGYTVTINGRQVSTVEPFIEITEQELSTGQPITIMVSSTNFETMKIERTPEELTVGTSIETILKPVEQGITLRLDFGEGRVFELAMMLEKNTPEYSQLHSGNFHGFRAHRLTAPGRGEIYNVDVRAASKPVSPKIVNATPTATVEPAQPQHHDPAGEANGRIRNERRRSNLVGYICGFILLAVAIGCAVYFFFPSWNVLKFSGDDEKAAPADSTAAMVANPDTTVMAPVVQPDTAAAPVVAVANATGGADDAYLNNSVKWSRDSLTTDYGRALFDAMAAGDIQAMASNSYFATPGRCTNADANKAMDLLWSSYGTSTEKSNQRCLTRQAEKGTVDVHQLYEDAARYRSPEPNKQPRPGK